MSKERANNAREEAEVVAKLLGLVQGRASGHGDLKIDNPRAEFSTVVYERNGRTFHLQVFDMTGFPDDEE